MRTIAIALGLLAACGDDGGATRIDAPIDTPPCDQQSDPTCCGAPEHSCLGAPCVAGVCQPGVLVDAVNASDLALTDSAVYFVQPAGTIERIGRDGSGRTTLASSPDTPIAVAVTGDTVVWATLGGGGRNGAIVRLAPGDAMPVAIATMEHVPCDLAIDGTGVVWASAGSGTSPYVPGEIRAVPTAGGTATTLVPSVPRACGIGLSGATVFYTAFGSNALNPSDGSLSTVPRGGGAPTGFATNRAGPRQVAVTGSHVYWTEDGTMAANYTDGRVMRMSRTGGLPEVLAMEVHPIGIAADGDAVYWTVGNQIKRRALAGGAPTVLATIPGRTLSTLVADGTALYAIAGPETGGGPDGRIVLLAK